MSFTATVMWSAMATTSPTCRAPRSRRGARTLASRPAVPRVIIPNNASPRRGLRTVAMSSKEGGGGGWGKFLGGVLVGGVVFGAAGVLFAPQLSKTFLKGKDAAGKFLYEDWTEDEDEDPSSARDRISTRRSPNSTPPSILSASRPIAD